MSNNLRRRLTRELRAGQDARQLAYEYQRAWRAEAPDITEIRIPVLSQAEGARPRITEMIVKVGSGSERC